jgi:hypothetical protein
MTVGEDDTRLPAADRQVADTGRRPARLDEIRPGGRREYTLTLDEVAEVLKVHVKVVRKLIKIQYEEDCAAALEHRKPRTLGLRAKWVSTRIRRVTEQDLGDFLHPPREQPVNGRT